MGSQRIGNVKIINNLCRYIEAHSENNPHKL